VLQSRLQPRLSPDRQLVHSRGRDGVDVPGDLAAAGQDRRLRPWLLGIATNVARNVRRAARRHDDALARLPRGEEVPDFAEEVVGRIDDAERLAGVRQAYGRLRRQEQDVFALCVWAGLDYAQAAEALGIPVGTVRSRLSRARKKLADAGEPPPARRQVVGDRGPEKEEIR
jgi:RNA polymerase sigma-70 factor (ECF subfamily)